MEVHVEWLTHGMGATDWGKSGLAACSAALRNSIPMLERMDLETMRTLWHPSRIIEYPWALNQAKPLDGQEILDIGSDPKWLASLCDMATNAWVMGHRTHVDLGELTKVFLHGIGWVDGTTIFQRNKDRLGFTYGQPWMIEGQYDTTYCISTLEHVEPDRWVAWLDALIHATRPGGRLVLTVDRMIDKKDGEGHPGMWNHPILQELGAELPPVPDDALILQFPDHGRLGVYGVVIE